MTDWDDAFANMAHVAGSDLLPARWTAEAQAYRAGGVRVDEHVYGDHPREKFDIVWPDGPPKGLAVFVHGGYWIRLDKSFWTQFAEGARAHGFAVCLPQYTLAPEFRITQITDQITRALTKASTLVDGPIRLSGHSAGGHLVTRMISADTRLDAKVLSRIAHTVSISGLHDLRPLMWTAMNRQLNLDEAEAVQESAVLHRPHESADLTCWVGGGERPEFIRQAKLLAMMWLGLDVSADVVVEGDHNHFTVIEGLKDKDSAIVRRFVGADA